MRFDVDVQGFWQRGCVTVSGLFSDAEVASYRQHFMDMRDKGDYPGDFPPADRSSSDPLKRYPRLIHMHRWDQVSLDWMIEPRLGEVFRQLLGPFVLCGGASAVEDFDHLDLWGRGPVLDKLL